MTVRWFATLGLVAIPLLAQAECGWLLMVPLQLNDKVADWTQMGAYDMAAQCETERLQLSRSYRQRAESSGKQSDREEHQLWANSRCLPASQVPVR
jgi:hypothetical protein